MEDIEFVYNKYENEGHGYAVEHYFGEEVNTKDLELNKLWKNAYISLNNLTNYFKKLIHDGMFENMNLEEEE